MTEENLVKQDGNVIQADDQNTTMIDKMDANKEKMSETEIRKRLSGRAMEYLMFIDD